MKLQSCKGVLQFPVCTSHCHSCHPTPDSTSSAAVGKHLSATLQVCHTLPSPPHCQALVPEMSLGPWLGWVTYLAIRD